MSATAKRRDVPVLRWLQVGAAAAGIGIALAASSGTAAADDGGSAGPADSAASASAEPNASEPSEAVRTDDAADAAGTDESEPGEAADEEEVPDVVEDDETVEEPTTSGAPAADQPAMLDVDAGGSTEAAEDTESSAPPTGSTDGVAAEEAVGTLTEPCGCDESTTIVERTNVELDRALTSSAYWLASHPRVPFGPFLEGAVYLVRRTLFPASVGVITSPVTVPLHFTSTTTNSGADKLGIYVAIGGSTRPVLFEFDTGSSGLYAAYASAVPTNSPWWGENSRTTTTTATVAFDSGLVYQGYTARAAVSLFASGDSCASLLNSGRVDVGQMDHIGTSTKPDAFWNPSGTSVSGTPPIDGAFYGDFGMSLNYKQDDILNVITQLTYGWAVRPGYLVHVDPVTEEAWVQIGLTSRDLRKPDAIYFDMVNDPYAPAKARVPHSRLQYYALQPFDATINIVDRDGKLAIDDDGIPILPDTGASTTIHNTQLSGKASSKQYEDHLVDWKDGHIDGKLIDGLTFYLTGTTTSGNSVTFFSFTTNGSIDGGRVDVQNTDSSNGSATDKYYLNAGISMFDECDLIYALGNSRGGGTIGLLAHGIQASERPRRGTTV